MNIYIKKNRGLFIGAIICVFIGTVAAVILQFFKGRVLDYALAGNTSAALLYAILLISFILIEVFFYFFYDKLCARFVTNSIRQLKADLFNSILKQDFVSFKMKTQGDYIAKYTNDVDLINRSYFTSWTVLIQIVIKVLLVSIGLFFLDWRIAIITLVLLTTPLYIPKLVEYRLQRAQDASIVAVEANLGRVTNWLSGFEMIKNFSIERKISHLFGQSNDITADKSLIDMQLTNIMVLVTTLISYLSHFIILAVSAFFVLKGEFSAGDFFIALGMIEQLSYPLISLARLIRNLISIRPACERMSAFIREPYETKEKHGQGKKIHFEESILFDHVTFSYQPDQPVISDFSLLIEKDKKYLIKGPSGCGKTSVTNLLLKYYEPDSGRIEMDHVPLHEYSDVYEFITVVRQDSILFNDSLRDNLTMYADIGDDKLIDMLSRLGLEKFISSDVLDMIVSEGGSNLSGGERKRICIARALLRNTDVLILDEPLANLDNITASSIEEEILNIQNRTILVVSHQFSEKNIGGFDRVIEMQPGNSYAI